MILRVRDIEELDLLYDKAQVMKVNADGSKNAELGFMNIEQLIDFYGKKYLVEVKKNFKYHLVYICDSKVEFKGYTK